MFLEVEQGLVIKGLKLSNIFVKGFIKDIKNVYFNMWFVGIQMKVLDVN